MTHRDVPLAELVLADMLAASADDLGVRLYRRDADRLARHALELLELAGYTLTRQEKP